MDGFSAYKFYLAIRLHYTRDSYDVFEKRGAVKYTREQFDKRNDRTLFEKLARKYPKEPQLIQFYVSNFAYGNDSPVYELSHAETYYTNWLRRKESITQVFTDELNCIIIDSEKNKLSKEEILEFGFCQPPSILTLLISNRISLETVCILNDFMDLISTWHISGYMQTMWEKDIRRICKSKRFVKYNRDKIISIINNFEEDLNSLQYTSQILR
jgi:hypothetical protein